MKAALKAILVLCGTLCMTLCDATDASVLLERTLEALEKGLDFFEKEHMYVNLDAVIGTRLVEGKYKLFFTNSIFLFFVKAVIF